MTRFTVTDARGSDSRALSEAEARNRRVVLDAYETQWRTRDFEQVRHLYARHYVDHNADVPGGDLDGLVTYIKGAQGASPDIEIEIRRVLVDGDFVAVHVRGQLDSAAPVDSVMEFYRLEDGLLAEHWEVVQQVPAETPNPAAMF